jgi:hypothetical protein
MAAPIPLIGIPQQLQFPQMNININPSGMQITIVQAPGYSSNLNIAPDMMDQIALRWKEEKCKGQDLMRTIEQSRN